MVKLTVPDVDCEDACRAALQEAVGEAARRRTEVGGDLVGWVVAERVERTAELDTPSRDERVIRFANVDRGVLIQRFATLLDPSLARENLTGQDQRLRPRARGREPTLGHQHIGANLRHRVRVDQLSLKCERRYLCPMARSVLFLLGVGSIVWALVALFFGSIFPEWMGLSSPHNGSLYIEALANNVGVAAALGVFGILGAAFQRLRLAAALAFLVTIGGVAGGRILGIVQGASPDVYTVIALALEVSVVVAASAAYVSEKARLSREAKELKRAEKAALEAALAKEHSETAEADATTSPVGQP